MINWKIEKCSSNRSTTLRLIGRMQAEHLHDLQTMIDDCKSTAALDLKELSLVDLEAVRFLGRCEGDGVHLLHCSRFIRDWITRERRLIKRQ